MKISLLVDRCQIQEPDALLPQVTRLLHGWGAVVKLLVPDACYLNLAHVQPAADLYLLTSCAPLALSVAGMLHAMGANLIHPYPVMQALTNKLIGLRILQAHGLPIPETYVAVNLAQLKELLAGGPLLIKAQGTTQAGVEGQYERVIHHMRDLHPALTAHGPVIAQRYIESFEQQWMIYCIGGRLISVNHSQPIHRDFRKNFILQPTTESWDKPFLGNHHDIAATESSSLHSAEFAEFALRCGRAFDIDLFGLKVMDHKGVLHVADMVSFPDFREAPETALHLAEYLYARAQFLIEKKRTRLPLPGHSDHLSGSVKLPGRLLY